MEIATIWRATFYPTFHQPSDMSRIAQILRYFAGTLAALLLIVGALFAKTASGQTAVADPPEKSAKQQTSDRPETSLDKAEGKEEQLYVRLKKNEDGKEVAMQTAVVRFEGLPGTKYAGKTVDLFGVVHIGEKEYYDDVDQRLSTYDSVLYELVAPDGTRIRPEDLEKRRGLLASVQTGMKDMLNLEYQLEQIDYMADNFRHADMSPDEFVKDMERRGDSFLQMIGRMAGASMAASANSGGDAGMLLAMFSDDRPKRLKKVMARQLMDVEVVTAGMKDANGEDTLIQGRNVKAFKVLEEELNKGKANVAVFYGAGHLPDMAERLKRDFKMKPIQSEWLDAWDFTKN